MKYLTKNEVAALLRVSVRTVTTYMSHNLLPPPLKLGRKLLWDESALISFLDMPSRLLLTTHPKANVRRGRPRKLIV